MADLVPGAMRADRAVAETTGQAAAAANGFGRQRQKAQHSFVSTSLRMLAVGGLAVLAGCGYTPQERTTGGAATGALSGAAVGAIAGPVGAGVGALVGAGSGAIAGAVTTPSEVNLGRPVWDRPNAHIGSASLDVCHDKC